jgi:hypothetical protein
LKKKTNVEIVSKKLLFFGFRFFKTRAGSGLNIEGYGCAQGLILWAWALAGLINFTKKVRIKLGSGLGFTK